MEIVNGYVCFNCTEAAYAQRNIDPANPRAEAREVGAKPKAGEAGATLAESRRPESDKAREAERMGENRPLAAGERGTRLNLLT